MEITDLDNTNVIGLEIEVKQEDFSNNKEYELPNQGGYIAFKGDTIYIISPGINKELDKSLTINLKENLSGRVAVVKKFDQLGQNIGEEQVKIALKKVTFSVTYMDIAEQDILEMANQGYLAGYEKMVHLNQTIL
ncbi:hypothetical protein AN396_03440 [Candidatus Epulonipiscium fishelsonii]|uniref:Uncharacterized protein n=1 Tax=Candidatus Epulonipiscium fishelsonii TaxID=77094 RepID=A0ACC8XEF9_9FIRM|nr:hypothetical protein AN396_03440 [Epulopiscium sp. SCG-B11WGA-EpuloA1]